MKHVVVADCDHRVRLMLIDYLSRYAFRATGVTDSRQLVRILATDHVDCIVVDPNLGHEDGFEIVRNLSRKIETPIIFISGDRLKEADKVLGFELGATHYIAKPVALREFVARVRASTRRQPQKPSFKDRVYRFGSWRLSMKARKLVLGENQVVELTAVEFNLLAALVRYPGQVLSREQLVVATRSSHDEVRDRAIDVAVLRLRRKLEQDPASQGMIKTERGIGYVFDCDVDNVTFPRP